MARCFKASFILSNGKYFHRKCFQHVHFFSLILSLGISHKASNIMMSYNGDYDLAGHTPEPRKLDLALPVSAQATGTNGKKFASTLHRQYPFRNLSLWLKRRLELNVYAKISLHEVLQLRKRRSANY